MNDSELQSYSHWGMFKSKDPDSEEIEDARVIAKLDRLWRELAVSEYIVPA